jgi:hypothetical protein
VMVPVGASCAIAGKAGNNMIIRVRSRKICMIDRQSND